MLAWVADDRAAWQHKKSQTLRASQVPCLEQPKQVAWKVLQVQPQEQLVILLPLPSLQESHCQRTALLQRAFSSSDAPPFPSLGGV